MTKNSFSLYYHGTNRYSIVNGVEIHRFKTKDSKVKATPLCLGNIFSVDNMKNSGLHGYAYVFSFDYYATAANDTQDIYKYFMKKNDMGVG